MKKGFTLVELLVVVVVIVTLLAITFRLAGMASDSNSRNRTIARLQRIENALSGYYAAFGSYPPVKLHARRNVYLRVNPSTGDQTESEAGQLEWQNVRAACRAQPFAARFPFAENLRPYVNAVSEEVVKRANSDDAKYKAYQDRRAILGAGFEPLTNLNSLPDWNSEPSWSAVKIFQFGVMSFLLPRYQFMLSGVDKELLDECAQWNASNRLSANPNNGASFGSWNDQLRYQSVVQRIPSQSVCARWMPNLEGIVACQGYPRFFGVGVSSGEGGLSVSPDIEVFSAGTRYVLDCMTVNDGWGNEFYYYSPAPFQSCRVWSAGPDGKTFPPWIPLETLANERDRRIAAGWQADDIMHMSH